MQVFFVLGGGFFEVWLINNVVLISAIQQSDSVIHTHVLFLCILFHYGLSPDIECSSLYYVGYWMGFLGGSDGKESACNLGDLGSIPGKEDLLGKGMATHSSILARRIPCTEEPGGPQFMGHYSSQRVGHDWATNTFTLLFLLYSKTLLFNHFIYNSLSTDPRLPLHHPQSPPPGQPNVCSLYL